MNKLQVCFIQENEFTIIVFTVLNSAVINTKSFNFSKQLTKLEYDNHILTEFLNAMSMHKITVDDTEISIIFKEPKKEYVEIKNYKIVLPLTEVW